MRRLTAGMLVVAGLSLGAGPAVARALELKTSGAVTVAWHGDPARGCAAAGMCGYSGTITLDLGGTTGTIDQGFGFLDLTQPAIARTRRDDPSGRPGVCIDSAGEPGADLSFGALGVQRLSHGRLRLSLDSADTPPLLATGTCAGPLPSDFAGALPSAVLVARRAAHRRVTVDMSGTKPFASGPLSGQVSSSLSLVARAPRRSTESAREPSRRARRRRSRTVRLLSVTLRYRVRPSAGRFVTSFRGALDPSCRLFDSCGASGSLDYAFTTRSGGFVVRGEAALGGRPPRSLREAVARVARGRAELYADGVLGHGQAAIASRVQGSGASCSDSVPAPVPDDVAGESSGRDLALRLTPSAPDTLLETRCPGPAIATGADAASLATGRVPLHALTRRRLELALRGRRSLAGSGPYTGGSYGGMVLDLRRVRSRFRVVTRRVPR